MTKPDTVQAARQVYHDLAPADQRIVNAILELAFVLLRNMQQVTTGKEE